MSRPRSLRLAVLASAGLALAVGGAFGVTGNDTITTIAGSGVQGSAGDGGPASAAQLNNPSGLALDAAGNVYIADTLNNRVRKVSGGTISTIAGIGIRTTRLAGPNGVAVDGQGNVFVADTSNHRVLRVVGGGLLTRVAGTGDPGYSGDGGPANAAKLKFPAGLAVDRQGNVYIADSGNDRVRKLSGGTITTIAGNGIKGFSGDGGPATAAQLNFPYGLAVDARGNVYIADLGNQRLRVVIPGRAGVVPDRISTIAGTGIKGFSGDGGQATTAQLNNPSGVAVDGQGRVYIADTLNERVRKVSGGVITTVVDTKGERGFAGDGRPARVAQLNGPAGLALDTRGNLFIADGGNHRVRRVANLSSPAHKKRRR